MGFQQELFEVDLERGDGDAINGAPLKPVNNNNYGNRAENAISYALVLLIAANLVQPTGTLGKTLGVAAALLSVVGTVMLVRRQPAAAHAKKILVILATVWVLYGVRLVHLGENGRIKMEASGPAGQLAGSNITNGNVNGNNNGNGNQMNAAMEPPPMPQPAARILPIRSFNLEDVNVGDEPGVGEKL